MIKEFYDSGAIKTILSEDFKSARAFEEFGKEIEATVECTKFKHTGKEEFRVLGRSIGGHENVGRRVFMVIWIEND